MAQVSLERLISAAQTGNLVSFPTDTVPALATLPAAAESIFATKQRSQNKPLILMAGRVEDLWQFTRPSAGELAIWQAVAERYLPGALTLVLPASELVPAGMNPLGNQTIGLRVPAHPVAQQILIQVGAMATTSANLSGRSPLLTMAEISDTFPKVFALDVEPDMEHSSSQPSTVMKWSDSGWELLRQGAMTITCFERSDAND
jgi:L-threonylcarbamoyladenylate synthase